MTILGIGVDLVEVARFEQAIARHGDAFLRRVFTADEIAYCAAMRCPGPHYAARFAAKEALAKAFGTGIGAQLGWQDIEIRRDPSGAPAIALLGAGLELATSRGASQFMVSLSHTAHSAVAQVLVMGAQHARHST